MKAFFRLFKAIALVMPIAFAMQSCNDNNGQDSSSENTNTGYTLNGKIDNPGYDSVYLYKRTKTDWMMIDSIKITGDSFSFKGILEMPEMLYLKLSGTDDKLAFFAENSKITIDIQSDSIEASVVSGSKINDQYNLFLVSLDKFKVPMDSAFNNYKNAEENSNTKSMARFEQQYDSIEKAQYGYIEDYVLNNKATVISPYITLRYLVYTTPFERLKKISDELDESISGSVYSIQLKEHCDLLSKTQIGTIAPDFEQNDTTGNPVKLSSLLGNYLLIDFWASWCGPCRRENPNLVRIYEKYHPKGFQILGVSLDSDKRDWINAIKKDGLKWHHVSDLGGWKNSVAQQYAINSIPHSVLIDPKGKIIARGLTSEELDSKLGLLFSEK